MKGPLIFDGHNDLLSRLWKRQGDPVGGFDALEGHINRAACVAGGLAGGFFAIFSPSARIGKAGVHIEQGVAYEPLAEPLEPGWALRSAIGQVGIARALHDAGRIEIVTTAERLARAFVGNPMACILHLEGADCIDADLHALDALHAMGLRSLGPVWSRPNIWGHGVPFAHHRDPDLGPGLTRDGIRLVQRCVEKGVMLDVSHITLRGFEDVAALGMPVVATHSNAWALCKASRNLTDAQLDIIRQSGGIAGMNFEPAFLSDEGWKTGHVGINACIWQLDYMIEALGEDHVGLGSDFDGARTPDGIGSAADLPKLVQAMDDAGFGAALIAKISNENWLAFLGRHLAGPR